jgi:hypothetical protein
LLVSLASLNATVAVDTQLRLDGDKVRREIAASGAPRRLKSRRRDTDLFRQLFDAAQGIIALTMFRQDELHQYSPSGNHSGGICRDLHAVLSWRCASRNQVSCTLEFHDTDTANGTHRLSRKMAQCRY